MVSLKILVICSAAFGVALCAEPLVESSLGVIRGDSDEIDGKTVDVFRGIPYAKPPIGSLRFAYPEPFGAIGEFDAKKFSQQCIQESMFSKDRSIAGSEDCLYLNVYRKSGTKKGDNKPVIVLIHGGGFRGGTASNEAITGVPLAGLHDVVVVTINYRLGIFGFADMQDLAPGNLGLLDQRLSLEWVQQNIRDFGGNPDKVTLMGSSAGSMSISAQINSPLNRGKKLFHAAIMDGGVMGPGIAIEQEQSMERVHRIAKLLNCPIEGTEMLECLRKADAKKLTELSSDNEYSPLWTFQPTMDGKFVPRRIAEDLRDNSADYTKVRTLVGYAKDEGTLITNLFSAKVPEIKNAEDFLKRTKYLGRAYLYPMDFDNETVKQSIIENYFEKTDSRFNDSASFVREGTFSCATNSFVKSYSKHNDKVYAFHFEKKMATKFSFISESDKMGVTHGTPFFYLSGSLLYRTQIFPTVGPVAEEDKQYSLDALKLAADFAKSCETPTIRGVKLPDFSKGEGIIAFDDKPYVRNSLLHQKPCREVFPFI